jgi:hypothetical protein
VGTVSGDACDACCRNIARWQWMDCGYEGCRVRPGIAVVMYRLHGRTALRREVVVPCSIA